MASQDTRQFYELPLGGTQPVARIHTNENEVPAQLVTAVSGGVTYEALGASLVNGVGNTFVRTVSPYFSDPRSRRGGGGNFVY